MTNKLTGKTALVTGGGSGIGKSICLRLADLGAQVLVLDRHLDGAASTADAIEKAGGSASALSCDVADNEQVLETVASVNTKHAIDILVNNAGIAHIGNVEDTSEADLDRLYGVNVKGVYNMLSATIPAMRARRSGVIVNIASIASSVGIKDRFAYSMTKGAVLTMTYSIARDYIDCGIRCNAVSPARVHTPFVDDFLAANYADNRDEMFDQLSQSQPIGRMGKADEVAAMVAFLCTDDAAFITGSNFPVDGGFVTLNN